jgi:hypothetical protein
MSVYGQSPLMDLKGKKSLVSERQTSISPRWSVQMAAYRTPAGGVRLEPLVGFWQHGTITVAKFLAWLGLCIVVHGRTPSLDGDGDLLPLETAEWGLFAAGEEGLLSEEPLQATLLVSDPGAPMPKGNFLILRRAGESRGPRRCVMLIARLMSIGLPPYRASPCRSKPTHGHTDHASVL